jgi:hypothetical protein
MSAHLFAIERWATRAPAMRWPLVLLALLLLVMLGGCGGSGAPIADVYTGQSTAQAGDADTGAAILVLPLQGPALQLDRPAQIHVRLKGHVQVSAHYSASGTVAIELAAPVATGPSTVPVALSPQAATTEPVAYTAWLQLPAGTHALQALLTLRARDAQAVPTGALARADASVAWRVEVQP